jgi:hypothetical protein
MARVRRIKIGTADQVKARKEVGAVAVAVDKDAIKIRNRNKAKRLNKDKLTSKSRNKTRIHLVKTVLHAGRAET